MGWDFTAKGKIWDKKKMLSLERVRFKWVPLYFVVTYFLGLFVLALTPFQLYFRPVRYGLVWSYGTPSQCKPQSTDDKSQNV